MSYSLDRQIIGKLRSNHLIILKNKNRVTFKNKIIHLTLMNLLYKCE